MAPQAAAATMSPGKLRSDCASREIGVVDVYVICGRIANDCKDQIPVSTDACRRGAAGRGRQAYYDGTGLAGRSDMNVCGRRRSDVGYAQLITNFLLAGIERGDELTDAVGVPWPRCFLGTGQRDRNRDTLCKSGRACEQG